MKYHLISDYGWMCVLRINHENIQTKVNPNLSWLQTSSHMKNNVRKSTIMKKIPDIQKIPKSSLSYQTHDFKDKKKVVNLIITIQKITHATSLPCLWYTREETRMTIVLFIFIQAVVSWKRSYSIEIWNKTTASVSLNESQDPWDRKWLRNSLLIDSDDLRSLKECKFTLLNTIMVNSDLIWEKKIRLSHFRIKIWKLTFCFFLRLRS